MDVALPADRRRVAEPSGDFFDRATKIALGLSGAVEALKFAQGHGRQHRPRPGSEILCRNVFTGNCLEIPEPDRQVFAKFEPCRARPPQARPKPTASQLAKSSEQLWPPNAPTISETQPMPNPKSIMR
jgi:hypothetical protein